MRKLSVTYIDIVQSSDNITLKYCPILVQKKQAVYIQKPWFGFYNNVTMQAVGCSQSTMYRGQTNIQLFSKHSYSRILKLGV